MGRLLKVYVSAMTAWIASGVTSCGDTVTLQFTEALEAQASVMIHINAAPGVKPDKVEAWGRSEVQGAMSGRYSLPKYLHKRNFKTEALKVEFSRKDRTLKFTGDSLTSESADLFATLYGDWINARRRRAIESLFEEYESADAKIKAEILPLIVDQTALLVVDWHTIFQISVD